jgi:hypothetical protein
MIEKCEVKVNFYSKQHISDKEEKMCNMEINFL